MKAWNLQLTSPSGKVFNLGEMGYAASTLEHRYLIPEIRSFLEVSGLTQRDFLLEDLPQMLLNEGFHRWHGYRLVWGEKSPEYGERSPEYPNGVDTKWCLYRVINGQTKVLLRGQLPENWWNLEHEDRQRLVERRVLDFEESSPDPAVPAV